jgi:hypothetical protein
VDFLAGKRISHTTDLPTLSRASKGLQPIQQLKAYFFELEAEQLAGSIMAGWLCSLAAKQIKPKVPF